jgi:hypothetical protein
MGSGDRRKQLCGFTGWHRFRATAILRCSAKIPGVIIEVFPNCVATTGVDENQASVGQIVVPGRRVRHPGRPDWGEGQVQSVTGPRVTVNFEHAGKVLVNTTVVALEVIDD